MDKRILITGGAGFIGANLGLGLKERYRTCEIIAFDNLKRRGSELNVPRLQRAGIRFVHGDVRNREDVIEGGLAPELILECSAEPSVLAGYSSPEYMLNTNVLGTIHCLELARRHQADMIFLSTSRVYPVALLNQLQTKETATRLVLEEEQGVPGCSSHGISEDFPLTGARSLYGATKLASELVMTEYAAAYGLRTIINRCGVITGPWQMGKVDQGVFALWVAAHYFGRSLSYIGHGGTGKQVRDLLHIADFVDLIDLQIARFDVLNGQVFNVGGGLSSSLSLQETTSLCRDLVGQQIDIGTILEDRAGDVKVFITDHRHVTHCTGWRPQREPRETLADIVDWMRASDSLVRPIFEGL
ncbi:MAG: NAD-dependent epimerase/dehydratase family protein [Candidatus Tectomicrobia bacterium]|nr:NAD-dependent epimerase/dehydratase family protein [Candidatus Tectomicrobia bacterium]